ncbi:glutathione S-transferase N-terminal domain-containing protein [Parvibaculum sp.]|uniref:glutathione S-transferase N-terminal domain-containing protein n=1 Tax=Parvibaculum sp. TaxID=2024848 RepID=UPI001D54D077|nr:glutathione S-transferase N-terminal domain-containing protein [Parvibaculum sp.]MBX3489252.1 glutathione S-transferase N-terminal domain-containing protein [Parvibaculum sp.]MCW5726887.1 glutathione S-transferase N-terminal domain-containing protein [Parvibaculum sp.]
MKLYHSPTSPFARKVRVLIREKGALAQVTEETASAMSDPQSLIAANPLGKVPALALKDGTSFFDSPLICEYLDATLDGPALFPAAGAERWRALRFQALADGIMDAAVSLVFETNRPEAERSEMWMARWRRAVARSLDLLEQEVSLLDAPLDIGGIATGAALGYLDFRHAAMNWQTQAPELAGWWRDMAKRPSFAETAPPA